MKTDWTSFFAASGANGAFADRFLKHAVLWLVLITGARFLIRYYHAEIVSLIKYGMALIGH